MAAIVPVLLYLLVVVFAVIYYVSRKKYNYWKKQKVPYLEPLPIVGNYLDYILMKKPACVVTQQICQKFPDAPYIGTYYGTDPTLIVLDPELIRLITKKDYYYFCGRENSAYNHMELSTKNLFFDYSNRWFVVRQNLTPMFTTAKLKSMFYLIEECAQQFEKLLEEETCSSNIIEVRSLMARYTIGCICSCGFGIDTKTMSNNVKGNPFPFMGNLLFGTSKFRSFIYYFRTMWPYIFYKLGLKLFSLKIDIFFHDLLLRVFEKREFKPSSRNDFVDLVLALKKENYISGYCLSKEGVEEKKKISIEVDDTLLMTQCVMVFGAGFETSATALTCTLFEIAKHQEAQTQVIKEVDDYLRRNNAKFSYDCVSELSYLNACIDETLRLYPLLGIITREVMENYTLPTGVFLKKSTRIHIPVYHLHRHPDFFPNPDEFHPERFWGKEKQTIKPYTYFPFGEGPRHCIGKRFSRMQMIPGLITLFKNYRVELADGMPRDVPLDPKAVLVSQAGCNIFLKFIPRGTNLN